jgi:preprotein translocase subunit SecD
MKRTGPVLLLGLLLFVHAGCSRTPVPIDEPSLPTERVSVQLMFHLAERTPAPGLIEAVEFGTGQKYFLYKDDLLTGEDVDGVQLAFDERHNPGIRIELTDLGSDKLDRVLQTHKGRPMAIVRNGEILLAPLLNEGLKKELFIFGGFNVEQAKLVIEKMK